jgi:hypothetical protein
MESAMKILLSLCCLLVLSALPLCACELSAGEWTGTYRFADDEVLKAKYHVEWLGTNDLAKSKELAITMYVAGVVIKFAKIQLADKQLSFQMNPGEDVACLLELEEDGTYKGECSSLFDQEDPRTIRVFMRPPQNETPELSDK